MSSDILRELSAGVHVEEITQCGSKAFRAPDSRRARNRPRRAWYLSDMEWVVTWGELAAVLEPYYPAQTGPVRRSIGMEHMLGIDVV